MATETKTPALDTSDNDQNEFSTRNISLASYLITEGYRMLPITYDEKQQGTFNFTANDSSIKNACRCFYDCNATVNITSYEHTRRKLLGQVKNGLP